MGNFPVNVNRWPGGTIPFSIEERLANDFPKAVADIQGAVATWNNADVPITLVPKTSAHFNYVHFTRSSLYMGTSCSSAVGMTGGKQTILCGLISLLLGGPSQSTMVHEVGHAVGLHHEHQRMDRDDNIFVNEFVAIWFAGGSSVDYTKLELPYYQVFGNYDCRSIMHYKRKRLGGVTYLDGKSGGPCTPGAIGNTGNLTNTDIATVKEIYS